jgi:hypothetical protein
MTKIKNQKITTKEEKLISFKRENRYCPIPTYRFNIGDFVHLGNLKNTKIIDIFDDGKFYEIQYDTVPSEYSRDEATFNNTRFVCWYKIRPLNLNTSAEFIKNDDIRLNYIQTSISHILSNVLYFGLDLNPDYQRGLVWAEQDKELLINSIFNNLDIGKFVFVFKGYSEGNIYEILDGKQRVSAIVDFYLNKFPYNGKYYNELSYYEQCFFENYNINIAQLEEISLKQKYRYFLLLNKTGKPVDKEHLERVEKLLDGIAK